MKNFLIFLAGLVTGAGLLCGIAYIYNNSPTYDSITIFDEEGDCISTNSFTVIQVVENGALAIEHLDDVLGIPSGLVVLFINEDGKSYYDSQDITIPKGKCARQIGIYKYVSKEEVEKTVPVVAIKNK